MRWLVVLSLLLAGCAGASEPAEEAPSEPLYDGEDRQLPVETLDEWYACDNATLPVTWYGHSSGSLWCEAQTGFGAHYGSIVTPATPMYESFSGHNGSVAIDQGTPVQGRISISCWNAVCAADVRFTLTADGNPVAVMEGLDPVVVVPLVSYHQMYFEGTLDTAIPEGAIIGIEIEFGGVGPLMLIGTGGDAAPWVQMG